MAIYLSRELVLKKLASVFPDRAEAEQARLSLDRYGDRPWHWNQNLVHLAILKASDGKLWRLRELVQMARHDFRDVVFLATRPEAYRRTRELSPLTLRWGLTAKDKKLLSLKPREEAAIRKRDGDQWLAWISS
jgi:hypothetical protein